MIAAETLTNRAGPPAKLAPSKASEVFLNSAQVSEILALSIGRIRSALVRGNLRPDYWDARGMPFFKATRLHEIAWNLNSEKADTTFRFQFARPGEGVASEIVIKPPAE